MQSPSSWFSCLFSCIFVCRVRLIFVHVSCRCKERFWRRLCSLSLVSCMALRRSTHPSTRSSTSLLDAEAPASRECLLVFSGCRLLSLFEQRTTKQSMEANEGKQTNLFRFPFASTREGERLVQYVFFIINFSLWLGFGFELKDRGPARKISVLF